MIRHIFDTGSLFEYTYKVIPKCIPLFNMKKEEQTEYVPHNCGGCCNFHFDRNRYWCGVPGSQIPIPSIKYVEDMRKMCKNFKKGWSHYHEW